MILRDWLAQAEAQLSDGPHPDRAKRDAETLLLHLIGKNKAWLMAHAEDDFAGCTAIRYAGLLERRRKGEPIQYITGECEFYGLPFRVTPDVLIPRPETEHLVEKVLALATLFEENWERPQNLGAPSFRRSLPEGWESTNPAPPISILDVGTGSGAIAVALAHHLTRPTPRNQVSTARNQVPGEGTGFSPYRKSKESSGALAPEGCDSRNLINAQITATDISPAALALALENATRNHVAEQIRFLQGDLLAPVAGEQFEIIASNPPYVPNTDRALISVEVREHEPHLALFGGDDGLAIYRRLIPAAHTALVPGGYFVFEFGFSQMSDVESLLKSAGFQNIEFIHDLQGIPRIASAQKN
jgi:release factor glutamine methyltransferase